MNQNNEISSIVSPMEALNRGNLFDYYYWPYKYVANIKPANEKEDLMMKIQMYAFAAHELNLYLDIYPNNEEIINLYNKYSNESNNYLKEYENKYGCITLNDMEKSPWQWINSPWPWEKL